jgi:uncharacterized membrane protein (DUF2068 family)
MNGNDSSVIATTSGLREAQSPPTHIKPIAWHIGLALLLVALLALVAFPAQAALPAQAAGGVHVTLSPDRNELTVGDPVQLALEVTHPAGYQVIIPKLEQVWGGFEVRSQSVATTTANDDGTETTRQTIEVTLFDLGDFETPPLPLTIGDGAGQVFEEVVPSTLLTVVPTLAEDDSELRDIKPQAGLNLPATWPWIAGGLLLAAVLAVAGWWAYRRWRGEPFLAPAVDNRPPWQVAYDELARIEGLGLLEQRRFKEYYTLVTDCLRSYLEAQFNLQVFERTTSELRVTLRQSDLAPEQARGFLDLFAGSDLVKFAKFTPDIESGRRLVGEARELVTVSKGTGLAADETLISDQAPTPTQGPGGSQGELAEFLGGTQLSYQSGQ